MTMRASYQYYVNLEWTGGRTGRLSGEGLPDLEVSAPPEFSGRPGIWSPEQLLVAATAACLMTTFLAVAEIMKIPVASYRTGAEGRLEKVPGEGYRFTEISLRPEIGVAAEDIERVEKLVQAVEKKCFISSSLRTVVRVEPQIVSATADVSR